MKNHGAAIACAVAVRKRPSYEEAVKHRPRGACYCNLDDRACYAAEHWEVTCPWTKGHCRDVRCTNCPHFTSGLRN